MRGMVPLRGVLVAVDGSGTRAARVAPPLTGWEKEEPAWMSPASRLLAVNFRVTSRRGSCSGLVLPGLTSRRGQRTSNLHLAGCPVTPI